VQIPLKSHSKSGACRTAGERRNGRAKSQSERKEATKWRYAARERQVDCKDRRYLSVLRIGLRMIERRNVAKFVYFPESFRIWSISASISAKVFSPKIRSRS